MWQNSIYRTQMFAAGVCVSVCESNACFFPSCQRQTKLFLDVYKRKKQVNFVFSHGGVGVRGCGCVWGCGGGGLGVQGCGGWGRGGAGVRAQASLESIDLESCSLLQANYGTSNKKEESAKLKSPSTKWNSQPRYCTCLFVFSLTNHIPASGR